MTVFSCYITFVQFNRIIVENQLIFFKENWIFEWGKNFLYCFWFEVCRSSLCLSLTHTHTFSFHLSLIFYHTHVHSHSLSYTIALFLYFYHTHSLTLSDTHTHKHTHTLPHLLPKIFTHFFNKFIVWTFHQREIEGERVMCTCNSLFCPNSSWEDPTFDGWHKKCQRTRELCLLRSLSKEEKG